MNLLSELKFNLGITDNEQDEELEKIIARGKAILEGLTGVTLDFEKEELPKSLCLDYCRYAYNNASEYFMENFKSEILRMQLQSAVSDYNSNKS